MIRTGEVLFLAAALLAGCAGLPPSPSAEPIAAADGPRAAAPLADTLATLTATDKITCLTTTSGAGYCWGEFIGEQKGAPVRILEADGSPARVRSVAPGFLGACAVMMAGDVRCDPRATGGWTDSAGMPIPMPPQCGYGACMLPLAVPGALGSQPVRDVTRGGHHACALAEDGTAYCWGSNSKGELGTGTWTPDPRGTSGPYTRAPAPTAGGVRFSQISTREWLTCGVATHNRGVYCWGYGQSGQAGDSTIMQGCHGEPPYANRACSTAVPTRVLPDSTPDGRHPQPSRVAFAQVSSGGRLACAADVQGRAFCWGSSYRCELGRCGRGDSHRAVQVPLPGRAVEVHAGYWFACARTADFRVFCWGDNTQGQLGSLASANNGPDGLPPEYREPKDGATGSAAYDDACFLGGRCSPAPVEVGPGRRWHALGVGSAHACGLAEDGTVNCWGAGGPVLGTAPRTVTCENRSNTWNDAPCQPLPVPVAGLPPLASPPVPVAPPPGRRAAADPLGIRATRVFASRRELRVIFPRDTARAWGWSELEDREYRPSYSWGIGIPGMGGPRTLSLHVARRHGEGARRFRSLEELVAAAPPALCVPLMFQACTPDIVAASVQDGAVVLTLHDSASVARLVGLRPEWATVWHGRPDAPSDFRFDSVRVEYVDPQVPLPDSALRMEAAAARRRYEASVNTISRYLSGPGRSGDQLWLAVGDSVTLRVDETKCHSDVCGGVYEPLSASGWRVGDSTIVRLRAVPDTDRALRWFGRSPAVSVIARRTGRTRLRVLGLTGPSDTLPSSRPVPRELEVTVIVTPPVARVELAPRVQVAKVGQQVQFQTRAFSAGGRVIAGAPVQVRVEGGSYTRVMSAPHLYPVEFDSSGRYTITASFGGLSDTLLVDVAPAGNEATSP